MIKIQEITELVKQMPPLDNYENVIARKEALNKLYESVQAKPDEIEKMYLLGFAVRTQTTIVRELLIECYTWLNANYNQFAIEYDSLKKAQEPADKLIQGPISFEELKMLSHYHARYPVHQIARLMKRTEKFILDNLQTLLNKRA